MRFDATIGSETSRVEVRERGGRYVVTVGERTLELDLVRTGGHGLSLLVDGLSFDLGLERNPEGFAVVLRGDRFEVELKDAVAGVAAGRSLATGPLKLVAPMPGKIVKVLVAAGDEVAAGQGVLVMEAMKMENELKAARAGQVQEVKVREGQAVEMGAPLLVMT